jgi:flagellar basal-body rod modification protein FlgD
MSTVAPTTSPVGTAPTTSASNPAAILGQDGFLQLLVAEMQNQDPLSQSQQDPTQSVTQMAQFSSVEQLTNLVQSSQQAQSIALIGHTVAYTDSAGNPGQGVVDAVTFNQGAPVIDVGGVGISAGQIVGVS